MPRKILSALVVGFLIVWVAPMPGHASSKAQDQAEKVKAKIAKMGTGAKARVKVKLKDGTSLRGHVTQIEDSQFVLVADKTGAVTNINYADVREVKTVTDNPASDPKVWFGLALIPAIIIGAVLAKGVD